MKKEIIIKVKTLDGQSRDIKISRFATVCQLKGLIEQITKMPKSRQRIIYQGRVLADTLVLGTADNGKMDGSAVHVVESAPPSTFPPLTSAESTQSRLLNGETNSFRDISRRNRNERSSFTRETTVRNRVGRMETLLNSLNASITALENGTSPEDSSQYLQNNHQPATARETGPMFVRDLAAFVGNLADGIERFPPRLREIQNFMAEDRPLQSRTSEEYARARSLIQNAMDAIRNLSNLTAIFSQLVIPLGDEPPRNLNIIQSHLTGPRLQMQNFIIPSLNESGTSPSNFGPGLIFGPFPTSDSVSTSTPTSLSDFVNAAVSSSTTEETQTQPEQTRTPDNPSRQTPTTTRRNANNRPGPRGMQADFVTSILTHALRPDRQNQNNSANRDGVNANISVQANITPSITIRLEIPSPNTSSQLSGGQHANIQQTNGRATNSQRNDETSSQQTNGEQINGQQTNLQQTNIQQTNSQPANTSSRPPLTANEVADNTPGLSREIMQQITNSVNRLNERGEALVIESNGPSNEDLGRVVGQAVAQTLQHLTTQRSASVATSTEMTVAASSTSTQNSSTLSRPSTSTSPEGRSENRKRKRKRDLEEIFHSDQLKLPIIEYLFGDNWLRRIALAGSEDSDSVRFMIKFASELKGVIVQDFIDVFNGNVASEKMRKFLEIILELEFLPQVAAIFFADLFKDVRPKTDCNIVESNLSLLRHFLRELKANISDPIKLGKSVVQFINLWVGLNCDILRGGQKTFERCLMRKMVDRSHSISHVTEFVTWSKNNAFSIDSYVMSEKIPLEGDVSNESEMKTENRQAEDSELPASENLSEDKTVKWSQSSAASPSDEINAVAGELGEDANVTPSKRRKTC